MEQNLKSHLPEQNNKPIGALNYKLTINGANGFVLNGLKGVTKSSPEFIAADAVGASLEIYGKNFKVIKLSVSDGVLECSGEITDFRVRGAKDNSPFWKRVFK